MLPVVHGEFGLVAAPDVAFSKQGTCWVKLRGAANDVKRDPSGQLVEGEPTFIDIVCFGKVAENLAESVAKGDRITVVGKLEQQHWEKDGKKETSYRIVADEVGVALRFGFAKTRRALDEVPASGADQAGTQAAIDGLGATVEEPPF